MLLHIGGGIDQILHTTEVQGHGFETSLSPKSFTIGAYSSYRVCHAFRMRTERDENQSAVD